MLSIIFGYFGFIFSTHAATPPSIITYQGKVLINEVAVTSTVEMKFVIYDSLTGSNEIYTASGTENIVSSSINVTPINGLFSVDLGGSGTNALDPIIFENNSSLYLEVSIGGETLSPRKRITSAPYAIHANTAVTSTYASTAGTSTYAETAATSTYSETAGTSTYANTAGTGNISFWTNDVGYVSSTQIAELETDPVWIAASTSVAFLAGNQTFSGANIFASTTFNTTTTLPGGVWSSNGWVGIGTITPSTLLTVAGTSTLYNVLPDMTGGTGNVSLYTLGNTTNRWASLWSNEINIGSSTWKLSQEGNARLDITNSNTTTPAISITQNNKVGIGTTAPTKELTVVGEIYNPLTSASKIQKVGTTSLFSLGSVAISGKYAYAISYTGDNFYVINVSDPTHPTPASTLSILGDDPPSLSSVVVSGDYAYLIDDTGVLFIVDISSPSNPTQIASTSIAGVLQSIFISGKYAYISAGSEGMISIVDISNPYSSYQVATTSVGNGSGNGNQSIAVSGKYAYVTNYGDDTISVVDISNPYSPQQVAIISVGNGPCILEVSGKYLYVVNNIDKTISVVNISNPLASVQIATTSIGGNNKSIAVSGKYAYVTSYGDDTISIVDISNPSVPVQIAAPLVGNGPSGLALSGKYAYVTINLDDEFAVIDLTGTEIANAYVSSLSIGQLSTENNIIAEGIITIGDSLSVGSGGIYSQGPLGVFSATTGTASSIFSVASGDSSNIFNVLSSGHVGIGTSTPDYALTVNGDINIVSSTGTSTIRFNGVDFGQYFIASAGNSGELWQSVGSGRGQWVSTNTLGIADSRLTSGTLTGQTTYWSGSAWTPTSSLFISSSGYVGVGTSTPATSLHVLLSGVQDRIFAQNTVNNSIITVGESAGPTGNSGSMTWNLTGKYLAFSTDHDSGHYTDTLVVKDGLVGIGTTTPGYGLDVQANSGSGYFSVANLLTVKQATNTYIGVIDETGRGSDLFDIQAGSISTPITSKSKIWNAVGWYGPTDSSTISYNVLMSNSIKSAGTAAYNFLVANESTVKGSSSDALGSLGIGFSSYMDPSPHGSMNSIAFLSRSNSYDTSSDDWGLDYVTLNSDMKINASHIGLSPDYGESIYLWGGGGNIEDGNVILAYDYINSEAFGKVGIGTTTPNHALTVNGDINIVSSTATSTLRLNGVDFGQYFIDSVGSIGQVWASDGDGRGYWDTLTTGASSGVGTSTINYFAVYDSATSVTGTSAMTVSGTQILIGTSTAYSATTTLTVSGALYADHIYTSGNSFYMNGQKILEQDEDTLIFQTNNTQGMWLQTTALAGNMHFDVTGSGGVLQLNSSGSTSLTSEGATVIKTTGIGSNLTLKTEGDSSQVIINASGVTSNVNIYGTSGVGLYAPTITVSGTISGATAVWHGNAIGVGYGGTGLSSSGATGSLMYSNGSAWALTNSTTANYILMANDSGVPTWMGTSSLGFTEMLNARISSGTLTGQTSYWDNTTSMWKPTSSLFISSAGYVGIGTTTPRSKLDLNTYYFPDTAGAANQILKTDASGELTWQDTSAVSIIDGTVTGSLTYWSGSIWTPTTAVIASTTGITIADNIYNLTKANGTVAEVGSVASTGIRPFVQGNYAYTVYGDGDRLYIFDISNPLAPTAVGNVAVGDKPTNVIVSGKYAYVFCTGDDTMSIVDISKPSAPVQMSNIYMGADAGNFYGGLAISGHYVYAAMFSGKGLSAIDVSNPSAPVIISTLTLTPSPVDIYVQGKYAYLGTAPSSGNVRLTVVDISNPASMTVVGSGDIGVNKAVNAIAVSGNFAYVSCGYHENNLIFIFDISNPASPVLKNTGGTSLGTQFFAPVGKLKISGNYLYAVDTVYNQTGTYLNIMDVSVPTAPVNYTSYLGEEANDPSGVDIRGNYAYYVRGGSLRIARIPGTEVNTLSASSAYLGQINSTGNIFAGGKIVADTSLQVGSGGIFSYGTIAVADTLGTNFFGGKVGIGNSSPVAQLSVKGVSTNPLLSVYTSSTLPAIYIDTYGNIGIGTTTPRSKLDLNTYYFPNADGSSNQILKTNGSGLLSWANDESIATGTLTGQITYWSGSAWTPTSSLFVSSSGYIGIGTTTPSTLLTVAGTSTLYNVLPDMTGGTGNVSLYTLGNTTNRWASLWANEINIGSSTWKLSQEGDARLDITNSNTTTPAISITQNNKVGIGTTTPTKELTVVGEIYNPLTSGSNIREVATTSVGNRPGGVAVSGKYAYVTNYDDNTMSVVDISNPIIPAEIATLPVASYPANIVVSNDHAYIQGQSFLSIVDISNPSVPLSVINFNTFHAIASLAMSGKYIYLSEPVNNIFYVVDISNPLSPVQVATTSVGNSEGMTISGKYVYATNYDDATISVIDISNSLSPVKVATTSVGSGPAGIAVSGKYLYVSNSGDATISVVDISNPLSPVQVATTSVGSTPFGVAVSGKYLYVSNGGSGTISIVDISNSLSPEEIATASVGSSPADIAVSGQYAYVANYLDASLSVVNLTGSEFTNAYVSSLSIGQLSTENNIIADGIVTIGTALSVGSGGIYSQGPLGVFSSATGTASNIFSVTSGDNSSIFNVLSNGYVGIGTSSPSQALDVVGNINITGSYLTNGGADYAEYFYSKDVDLVSGEAVCVDVTKNNAVKRCTRGADPDIMGIVSTHPSIIGNNTGHKEGDPNYKIIGMLGQVAAKLSAENGPIRPGDSLTSASSTPGYLMRADAGDSTVGVALEGLDSGMGMVNVLISRRNKSITVEQVEEKITRHIADMKIEDEVQLLVNNAVGSYDFGSAEQLSALVDSKLQIFGSGLSARIMDNEIDPLKNSLTLFVSSTEQLSLRVDNMWLDLRNVSSTLSTVANDWALSTQSLWDAINGVSSTVAQLSLSSTTTDSNLTVENLHGYLSIQNNILDLSGALITNLASIAGKDNKWRIDEDGRFVTRLSTSEGDKDMYAMQSPAAEFVFSSSSILVGGEARIEFDTSTREIIDENQPVKVTVSLTSGEGEGIFVKEKGLWGFVVKELKNGLSNASFDWIVVAKRKDAGSISAGEVISENPETIIDDLGEITTPVDVAPTSDPVTSTIENPTATTTTTVTEDDNTTLETPAPVVIDIPAETPPANPPPVEEPAPIVETPVEQPQVEPPASEPVVSGVETPAE
ncbi:MAG: beta-propeller fold lactonase family protein [Candidatus Magasanikbacteria bacterium]